VDILHEATGTAYIPKKGELRALMDVRDVDIPKYENAVDDLAKTIITEVNKIHQTGYALSGLSYIDFFDSDPQYFNAANIKLGQAIKDDINNIAAGIGGKIDNVDMMNVNMANLDITTPNNPTLSLQDINEQYRHICKGTLKIVIEGQNPPRVLQEGVDYYVDYQNAKIIFHDTPGDIKNAATAGNLRLSFDYNATGYSGPGDGDNALLLSQLRNKLLMQGDVFGNSTQTVNQFYSGLLGRLGTERNEAAKGLDGRVDSLKQLSIRQNEIMGVNLDEEIANLIQYQHTYQASARYLTTINTMLETLLNM